MWPSKLLQLEMGAEIFDRVQQMELGKDTLDSGVGEVDIARKDVMLRGGEVAQSSMECLKVREAVRNHGLIQRLLWAPLPLPGRSAWCYLPACSHYSCTRDGTVVGSQHRWDKGREDRRKGLHTGY